MGFFGLGKDKRGVGGKESVVKLPQVPETMRRAAEAPSDRERIETEIISECETVRLRRALAVENRTQASGPRIVPLTTRGLVSFFLPRLGRVAD